jgi:arabinofuranosyltransferase
MPNPAATWRARLARIPPLHALLLALAIGVLVVRARGFLPFIADDALISLRYARRLLDGHGLTWTDGPRVEGYSNLLWVLGCALLGWLGLDLILAARCLGMAATITTLVLLAWCARARPWLACLASLASVALAGPIAVWAIGGLEQPLLGLWIALGLACSLPLVTPGEPAVGRQRATLAGFFFGLAALTRPDGLLFGAAVGAVLMVGCQGGTARIRLAIRFLLPVFLMAMAQLSFRWFYYGQLVPNTGRAKLAISPAHIVRGWYHVWDGLVAQRSILLVVAASLVVAWLRGDRRRVSLIAAPLGLWLGYLTLVGGDIFPAWRHFVPVLVLGAFLVAEGTARALELGAAGRWVVVVVLVNACFLGLYDQSNDRRLSFARTERWEWNGEVVGRLLGKAFGAKAPLLAVDASGCLPYFSGLPSLDMLGLNDGYLARHPPADFGQSTSLGHELGNGPYVLEQKPDLVIFCLPGGGEKPCFRSGREMVQLDGFRDHYQLVAFEGEQPYRYRSLIWVRRDSPKIGVQAASDRLTIPGFLVGDSSTTTARLDTEGRLEAEIEPQARVTLPEVVLPAGRYLISAETAQSETLVLWVNDANRGDIKPTTPVLVDLSDRARIELSNPSDQPRRLRRVGLVRAADAAETSP